MNRYPGIAPFSSEQKDIFFGRDKDIEDFFELISLEKKVLLYSKSGLGKTSLLNAGVIPLLETKTEYIPIQVRFRAYDKSSAIPPLQRIIDTLRNNSKFDFTEHTILNKLGIENNNSLWFILKRQQLLGSVKKLIFVFDQFEELFSYPEEQIQEFNLQLSEILETEVPKDLIDAISKGRNDNIIDNQLINELHKPLNIKSIFVVRSDRLSELNKLSNRLPDIQKVYYELKPLTIGQAKQAIIEPAQKNGNFNSSNFIFNPDAIDKILNYLTKNYSQNVETTQLQIICQRIELKVIKEKISNISIEYIPDFKNVFIDFYTETIEKLPKEDIDAVRVLIEDNLIRNKQRISLDENICKDLIKESTLKELVNSRLLRAEYNTVGGLSYELSHDTLIEPVEEASKERKNKEKLIQLRKKQKKILIQFIAVISIVVIIIFLFLQIVQKNELSDALTKVEDAYKIMIPSTTSQIEEILSKFTAAVIENPSKVKDWKNKADNLAILSQMLCDSLIVNISYLNDTINTNSNIDKQLLISKLNAFKELCITIANDEGLTNSIKKKFKNIEDDYDELLKNRTYN